MCGLILMCMMPRAISRQSATYVGIMGRVRFAVMLDCKEIALALQKRHVTWCCADWRRRAMHMLDMVWCTSRAMG